jgi:hypothetical protein
MCTTCCQDATPNLLNHIFPTQISASVTPIAFLLALVTLMIAIYLRQPSKHFHMKFAIIYKFKRWPAILPTSVRQNVHRQNVRSAKCPFGKISFGKVSFSKMSGYRSKDYTSKTHNSVETNLQQTCSNAVPTTCQQDVFALLVPSLLISCQRLVDNLPQGC